jgi:hypothetical protein
VNLLKTRIHESCIREKLRLSGRFPLRPLYDLIMQQPLNCQVRSRAHILNTFILGGCLFRESLLSNAPVALFGESVSVRLEVVLSWAVARHIVGLFEFN